jgi:hypothetical protein
MRPPLSTPQHSLGSVAGDDGPCFEAGLRPDLNNPAHWVRPKMDLHARMMILRALAARAVGYPT